MPHDFPAYLLQPDLKGWPSMTPAQACRRHVMIDGKTYRTVSDKCWDTVRQLPDLEAMELSLQAISPVPELFGYWLPAAAGVALNSYVNDQIAEMISRSEKRLAGLAGVPLQDLDAAISELHRIMAITGFRGVEIGSNVNGRPVGAPEWRPFFAAAEVLGAAVFVHAVRPARMDWLIGSPPLQQALDYPPDVGSAAASVITSNLLEDLPNLRIAFSHGGGTLGLLLQRLEHACGVFPAIRDAVKGSPSAQAQRLFYDTLVFDTQTLQRLVEQFGASQLMIGTNYPFNFHDRTPLDRIRDAVADPAV